jgi:hypothetical protein
MVRTQGSPSLALGLTLIAAPQVAECAFPYYQRMILRLNIEITRKYDDTSAIYR